MAPLKLPFLYEVEEDQEEEEAEEEPSLMGKRKKWAKMNKDGVLEYDFCELQNVKFIRKADPIQCPTSPSFSFEEK